MSWESAHAGLNILSAEHGMLHLDADTQIDLGDFAYNCRVLCYYPNPKLVQKNDVPNKLNSFYRATLDLNIRPKFYPIDHAHHYLSYPPSVQVCAFHFFAGLTSKEMEVVVSGSRRTAGRALAAWEGYIKVRRANRGKHRIAA